VLWDIDHTLIDVAGLSREIYGAVFRDLIGRPVTEFPDMAGRTDRSIITALLDINGVPRTDDLVETFAEALARELGVKAEFQPTKWDGILAALESGRLDAVINQVTITEERSRKYDFSTPYTVSGIQAMARKDNAAQFTGPRSLAGKKVGVGLGTNYEQWLKENVPDAVIKTYDDDPTKLQDLRFGRIDAILIDRLAAFDMVEKTGGQLVVAGQPFSRQEAGVALRKGNAELLAAINRAIAKLRADGTLGQLSEKWFKADVTQ